MTRIVGVAVVLLLCAIAPLLAPQEWAQHGPFPDAAALSVLYIALRGTPERAAVVGVAIGLVRTSFSPDPAGLDAALYGALGWSGAHVSRSIFQDRLFVKCLAAGAGVVLLRGGSAAFLSLTVPGVPGTHGMALGTWLAATLLAAAATALAAPVAFAGLSATRLLAPLERRRVHDV